MESQENVRAKSYAAIPCFCSPYGPGGDTEGNPRRRPAARENLVAIARRKRRRSDVDIEFSVHVGVVVNQPAEYHEMNLEYVKEKICRETCCLPTIRKPYFRAAKWSLEACTAAHGE